MSGARSRAVAAVAAGLVLAAGLGWRARIALHGCVDAGSLASAALHVSLLRPGGACPSGEYALGPASGGAVLVLSIALPVLVADVLLAVFGLGAWAVLRAGLRTVADAGHRYLRPVVPGVLAPFRRVPRPAVEPRSWVAVSELLGSVGWSHRGPPLAA